MPTELPSVPDESLRCWWKNLNVICWTIGFGIGHNAQAAWYGAFDMGGGDDYGA